MNQPLRKFRVVFTSQSCARLKDGEAFEGIFPEEPEGDVLVRLRSVYAENDFGIRVPSHLQVEVEVFAADLDTAIAKAGPIANATLATTSLSVVAAASPPRAGLAYDITPDITEREFIQYFYEPLPVNPTRTVPIERLITVIDRWVTLSPRSVQARVGRALRWYRDAVLETDLLDIFVNLWLGLESLNKPIIDKFGVSPAMQRCTQCGAEREIQTTTGVRHLICMVFEDGGGIYRRARKVRTGLMHGYEELGELVKEAAELNPLLEEALVRGILELLEIPAEEREHFLQTALTNVLPFTFALPATLHQSDPNLLGVEGQYPHYVLSQEVSSSRRKEDGSRTYEVQMVFTSRTGCRATVGEIIHPASKEELRLRITKVR